MHLWLICLAYTYTGVPRLGWINTVACINQQVWTHECVCCHRDKHIPKLYSLQNITPPGLSLLNIGVSGTYTLNAKQWYLIIYFWEETPAWSSVQVSLSHTMHMQYSVHSIVFATWLGCWWAVARCVGWKTLTSKNALCCLSQNSLQGCVLWHHHI